MHKMPENNEIIMIDTKNIKEKLMQKMEIKNPMELPYIEKMVINVGAGKAVEDKKYLEEVCSTLKIITGQKPQITKAKKSISGFKLRQGENIGAMVTLRGSRMLSFLEKLVNIVLPRIRDFKGLSLKHFDRQGNYTFALKEQVVFPEVPYDAIQNIHGMQITIKIKNTTVEKSKILLEIYGMPFEKKEVHHG